MTDRVAPGALPELFAQRRPAAILTGFYAAKRLGFWEEDALARYARSRGYVPREVVCNRFRARLFLPPDG